MIANRRPDPRLRLDADAFALTACGREFFRRGTVSVARSLIGKWIARSWRGRWYGGRIVETEAYLGARDRAAHSWAGRRTPRVEPMYGDGGLLYVFLVYGMHCCANVVTRKKGQPEAVLIRAAEGPPGAPTRLMSGPGKLCAALGITVADSGADLVDGGFRIFGALGKRPRLAVTRRIGVDYAGEAKDWPLRFYAAGSPAVSGRQT